MAPLTIRAAAERLGVGYSTFKRWVHMGRVRTLPTEGGRRHLSEAKLDRLAAHQQPDIPSASRASDDDEVMAGLSARNRLRGFVDEVRIDGLLAQLRLRVGDQRLTAVITADAVKSLKLRRGDDALAIIKSTEVVIAKSGRRPLYASAARASSQGAHDGAAFIRRAARSSDRRARPAARDGATPAA